MADTVTTNYSFTKVEVGASDTTWGGKLNANWDAVDAALKAASDVANAALPKAGGTMTGDIVFGSGHQLKADLGTVGAPGVALGDADSGLYESSDDVLEVVTAGAARLRVSAAGVISYIHPDLGTLELGTRRLVRKTTAGTLTADMVNSCRSTTANVTVNADVFAAGDCLAIFNRGNDVLTIIAGAGMTLRLNGVDYTGNLTLAGKSFCSLWFESATECVVMGAVQAE